MRKIVITILLLNIALCLFSQKIPKETLSKADDYFYKDEYEEALPLLLEAYKIDPENANVNYKIGVCYLYIEEEKENSISYLETAVQDVSIGYKMNSLKERRAPIETYYSLGTAYHINNRIDEAIDFYTRFRSALNINDFETIKFVGNQIKACENAKKLLNQPIQYRTVNLGSNINSSYDNYSPVISGDGQTLAYASELETYTAVYISKKVNNNWSDPEDITGALNSDGPCIPTSLSYDGNELYLFKEDNYDGNIYISRYSNGLWQGLQKLNKNINTTDFETHASVSADGKTLYFTSTRRGGEGGLDIYKTEKDATGDWGPAKNLGRTINTEFNEETPFITTDGERLYFSSEGHFNMGGFDIFYSKKSGTRWSKPTNLGYPVNSTDYDVFYFPVNDENGLQAKYEEGNFGRKDIYEIKTAASALNEVKITGKLSLLNYSKTFNPSDFKIDIRDNTGSILQTLTPYAPDGYFSHTVMPGYYELAIQSKDFKPKTEFINIPDDFNQEKYDLLIELEPMEILAQTEVSSPEIPIETNQPVAIIPPIETQPTKTTQPTIKTPVIETSPYKTTSNEVKRVEPKNIITTPVTYSADALYTIQILALLSPVETGYFDNLSDVNVKLGNDQFYRYTYGGYKRYSEAKEQLAKVVKIGYNDAFIKKIEPGGSQASSLTSNKYTIQLMALYTPVDISYFNKLKDVRVQRGRDKFYRYTYGEYQSYENARNQLEKLMGIGYADAFIKKIK